MRPALAFLAVLFLLPIALSLAPAPLRAEDPPAAAAEPEHWISILATVTEVRGKPAIKVEGQAGFPDTTLLDITIEHRGQPADDPIAVRVVKNAFAATFNINQPILPGYYQVKAAFGTWRQDEPLASQLGEVPATETFQPILVGTVEEARKAGEEALTGYEREIGSIETIYSELRKVYQEILKHHDLQKSPEEWNSHFANIPQDIQKEVERLKNDAAQVFLPAYPLLHNWAIEGWGTLSTAYSTLTEGVVVEITEMMSRKKTDRQFFLKKADELVYGYIKGMRAQILLERNGELRERLVYQTSRLLWFHQQSANLYRIARTLRNDTVKEEWKAFATDARKELDSLAKDLKQHDGGPLARQYPQLVSMILKAPDSLLRTWQFYERVILEGVEPATLAEAIAEAENQVYLQVVPAIEVLGVKKDAFNRMMQRGFAAGTSPADKDAKDVPIADDPEQRMGDYLSAKIDALAGGAPGERLRAMKVILSMGPNAKPLLHKTIAGEENAPGRKWDPSGGKHAPEVLAMCHVCLARLGETSSEKEVVGVLAQFPEDDGLRAVAAATLGILAKRAYAEPLAKALAGDKGVAVRMAAARALADLKTMRGGPALIAALSDAEVPVRQAALASLETLAGKKMNFTADAPEATRKNQVRTIEEWWKTEGAALLGKEPADDAGGDKKPADAKPAEGPK